MERSGPIRLGELIDAAAVPQTSTTLTRTCRNLSTDLPAPALAERKPWTCQGCGTSYRGIDREHPLKPGHRLVLPPPPEGDCAICKESDRQSFLAEQQARDDKRTAARFMRWSQIGEHYQNCHFRNFQVRPGTEQALTACQAYVENFGVGKGEWLLLCGSPGSGKTHLAMAVRNAVEADFGGLNVVTTQPFLLGQIQATWGRRDPGDDNWTESTIMDKLQAAKTLTLDDLMEFPSWAYDRAFQLIDGRYRMNKATIFTSNLAPSKVEAALGDRLWSRMMGRLPARNIVHVQASDYRREVERRQYSSVGG